MRLLMKSVAEDATNRLLGLLFTENRNRSAEVFGEQSRVVESVKMVDMVVRIDDGMNKPDPLTKELNPHFRGRVDQKITLGKPEQDARPRAVIARVL